jgi:hypothetical protein
MGKLTDIKKRIEDDIEAAKEKFKDRIEQSHQLAESGTENQFTLLGQSVGKVMGFRVLRAGEIGYPRLELTFTDRGLYFYNGEVIPGGTNATYEGFMDSSVIFYGQGNGMSVAEVPASMQTPHEKETAGRTSSTWYTEGVAQLEPTLTGAGTYRGSILYRWVPGAFAGLNPMPAVFQLIIDDLGFTFGTIWRWVPPAGDTSSSAG